MKGKIIMSNTVTFVLATGGFDPIHKGHIKYLEAAKTLGTFLIVGLNSNDWLIRKKGKFFMDWNERRDILKALRCVDFVWVFDDLDDSASQIIEAACDMVMSSEPRMKTNIIFANGGDRTATNIPEQNKSYPCPVEFIFGVGGEDKIQSSSSLLDNWNISS